MTAPATTSHRPDDPLGPWAEHHESGCRDCSAASRVMLDRDDVSVVEFTFDSCPIGNSDDCTDKETHQVLLDMRGNGFVTTVATGCGACCKEFADRLRASLPECANRDGTR